MSVIIKILREVESYKPVIQALSLARTVSIVGVSTLIMLQQVWQGSKPCLEKIQDIIVSCIHSIL